MESNRRSFRFYPLYTALFSQSGFSRRRTGYGVLILETYKPFGTGSITICRYWMLSMYLTTSERNLSAISMSLSFEIYSARISLLFASIATHSQIYSNPTLIIVSSTMNSRIFLFLEDIFFGWLFLNPGPDGDMVSSDKT